MGPTAGALMDALRETVRRPLRTLAVAALGWLLALGGGAAVGGLVTVGRGQVAVPTLTLAVLALTAVALAVGNAVLVASVWGERVAPNAGVLGGLRRGIREGAPASTFASILLTLLVIPATVVAGVLGAVLLPGGFLGASHGTSAGVPGLAYALTLEPSSVAVVVTVLLGDWLTPYPVHVTVATLSLLVLTPVRFVDAAAVVEGARFGALAASLRATTTHPVAAVGYVIARLALLGTAVALLGVGWVAGDAAAGYGGALLGVALASGPAAVVAFSVVARVHLGWYERARLPEASQYTIVP